MKTKAQQNHHQNIKTANKHVNDEPKRFVDHLLELRRRLIICVLSVLFFGTAAYFVQQQIVNFLLKPANGQHFIYTSPLGGINFLFSVCTYTGIALSTPVIIYQFLQFFRPLMQKGTHKSFVAYSISSALLGVAGFSFGYFIGLPAALKFLGHQFTSQQVNALFTLQEYMTFLSLYLLGSILLFQLPLIILFINRIKPLKPSKLFKGERYVIVGATVVSMIMAPTPNILDLMFIVVPIILMYNLSILLVKIINNRKVKPKYSVNTGQVSSELPMVTAVQSVSPLHPVNVNIRRTSQVTPKLIMDIVPISRTGSVST